MHLASQGCLVHSWEYEKNVKQHVLYRINNLEYDLVYLISNTENML